MRTADVVIVGASLSAAAAAKRLVDAGLETIILERLELPRHKICSGILSPRGHRFLLENFGPLPREALHEPTSCRGVTFHFPSMVSMSIACSLQAVPPGLETRRADSVVRPDGRRPNPRWESRPRIASSMERARVQYRPWPVSRPSWMRNRTIQRVARLETSC